ncbi:endonuclease/exonuclease/phosphatase family protein [Nocardia sp. NPDC003963]
MNSTLVRTAADMLAWSATLAGTAGIGLHFSRSSAQLPVLAASGAPYLMGSALVGVAAFAAGRRWSGAGLALLVATAGMWTQLPLYRSDDAANTGHTLTVLQANLLFDGAEPRAFVDEVRARQVDLLTVDELTPAAVEALGRAGLDELLPHRYLSPGRTATGTGIWSSYPLSDTVEYDGFVLNQLSATATVPDIGPVAVYAFHPVPPVYGTRVWADELSRLDAILRAAPADRPAIVGGDFNATYDHAQYRALLDGRFADAAVQAGAGHLVTYPTDKRWPPLVGIDHILVAGGSATTVETAALPGADHRALVARIGFPDGGHPAGS